LQLTAAKSYEPYQDLESASMMAALLDEPHLVFDHIRRYTNSVATQFVYGFRTPRIDDPKLVQLYDSVEKWSAITGAGSAALLDVFPILRSLPAAVRPLYNYALSLKREYFDLALSHWGNAKRGVQEGTAKVRFPHFHLTPGCCYKSRLADASFCISLPSASASSTLRRKKE
jgi:hypothetical protein